MESTVRRLEDNCRSLQATLHTAIPTVQFTQRPLTSDVSGSRPTGSCVPYEALGTLRMNRLNTASRSRGLSSIAGDEEEGIIDGRGTKSSTLMSFGSGEGSEGSKMAPNCSGGVSVSTQTTETAFALCARCSETQNCLVSIASSVSQLCTDCERGSSLAGTDWSALAGVGGLVVAEWKEALENDVVTLDGCNRELKEKCRQLDSELCEHRETIEDLKAESRHLSSELAVLQASIGELERRGEASLTETREELTGKVRALDEAREKVEAGSRRVREELNSAHQREAKLRAMVADLG